MISYDELIEKSISKEVQVLGEKTALSAARGVEGLEVNDDGKVTELNGNGKKVLGELVKTYQDIGGSVSASLIAREVESEIDDDSMLPEILAKRVRVEEFASAI